MAPRTLLTNASKLPTHFDYWSHRLHALLGLYVISHFLYRYGLFFFLRDSDDMGFDAFFNSSSSDATEATFVVLFLPHLLLQISGFAFPLPIKRHPDGNRIWPQYRFEALIFCVRCLSLAFIAWRRKLNNWKLEDGSCSVLPAAFCVFLTMMMVDLISRSYGTQESRTIRGLKASREAQYFMSTAQFHATVHCLLTSNQLSVQIAALTVVQLSAFGMTLRRKGFISQRRGVSLYAFMLVVGMIVIFDDLRRRSIFNVALFLGNSASMLRLNFGMNKYVMWSGVVIILTYLMQEKIPCDEAFPRSLLLLNYSSWLLLVCSCFWKCNRQYQ